MLASGEIAAALVLPGPGVLNAVGGHGDGLCCLVADPGVTGIDHQREGHDEERERPLLHELTKRAGRDTVEEVPGLVHAAMAALRQGRQRPVILEVPHDVLAARRETSPGGERAPWVCRGLTKPRWRKRWR